MVQYSLVEIERRRKKRIAIYGIILFWFIHMIFEMILGNGATGPTVTSGLALWYVRRQINRSSELSNPFVYGMFVSSVIFISRLIIGFVMFEIIKI